MKTLSLDLRERILAAYDARAGTRKEVAERFMVSEAMVKKLLQQRRKYGDLGDRHHCAGRKPTITPEHRVRLRVLLEQQPDQTLVELRDALGLAVTPQALHYVLKAMRLPFKKNAPAERAATRRRPRAT